jgi:hypothetical protein
LRAAARLPRACAALALPRACAALAWPRALGAFVVAVLVVRVAAMQRM